jgi:hypothetical protein
VAFYEVNPYEALEKLAGNHIQLSYADGYNIKRGAGADQGLINSAVQVAAAADVVIYVGDGRMVMIMLSGGIMPMMRKTRINPI